MEKPKKMIMVLASDVMQKYFEDAPEDGSEESKLGEVIEKCKMFPDRIEMTTSISALIYALKNAKTIDGKRVKKLLNFVRLVDVCELKKAAG